MRIIIKDLEIKKVDEWIVITDENGKKHNVFKKNCDIPAKIGLLQIDNAVELVKVPNGKFWDTVDIKASDVGSEATSMAEPAKAKTDYAAFYLKQNSIEMQNARTNVTNLWIAWMNQHKDELPVHEILTRIILDTITLAQGIPPPAQAEALCEPLQSENIPAATVVLAKMVPIKVPASFANVGEFYQWCLNSYKMGKTKVDAKLKEHHLVVNPLLIKSNTDIALVADILAVRG